MSDKELVRDLYRCAANAECRGCHFREEKCQRCVDAMLKAAADRIEELGWHNAKTNPPTEPGHYLTLRHSGIKNPIPEYRFYTDVLSFVLDGEDVDEREFRGRKNMWYVYDPDYCWLTYDNVAYWAYIPEMPWED